MLASKYCAEYLYHPKTYKLETYLTIHEKYLVLTDQDLDNINKISIRS
jgi:hypothetical protein